MNNLEVMKTRNIFYRHNALIFAFILFWSGLSAQTRIKGVVKDAQTHQPIPFCGVSIKNTTTGTIANAEGVFSLMVDTTGDVLVFSSIGYQRKFIAVHTLQSQKTIYLNQTNVSLNDVTIHATNDYLYKVINKCRKKIPDYKPKDTTKVYLGLETFAKKHPIELLEIYYNGYLKGVNIDKLLIKNGRDAFIPVRSDSVNGNRYYVSLATSLALSNMHLTKKSDHFAGNPLQFGRRRMKKYFNLHFIDANKEYIHIGFSPRQDTSRYFSGELWIDKNDNLLKIILKGNHISIYPFIPIMDADSIYNFKMNLQEVFKPVDGHYLPNYINFNYQFKYKSVRRKPFKFWSVLTNKYKTKGVLYFYDYNKPFILPYFDYDPTYDDYRKMTFIPYNTIFWEHNNKVPLTKTQKKDLSLLSKKGTSLHFNKSYFFNSDTIKDDSATYFKGFDSINPRKNFFEFYNINWSRNHRISISKSIERNDEAIASATVPSRLYKLKVQILLDVTQVGDSLYHKSYTVFDRHQSFYHLPRYPFSNCFINVYFDICEIERRKMEKKLPKVGHDLNKINAIYKQTKANLKAISKRYFHDVFLGKNTTELKKWSNYVKRHLGIDNMKMYSKEMAKGKEK